MTVNEREIKQKLRAEFACIVIDDPEHFSGGCMKSVKAPGWCCGLSTSGSIGKFHHGCRYYVYCEGRHMQYNP
jgi:hypothetical protein